MLSRNDQTTTILDLHHDSLRELFRYLNAQDILNFSFTNKESHEFVNNILNNNPRFLVKLKHYRKLKKEYTDLPQLSMFGNDRLFSKEVRFLRDFHKYSVISLVTIGSLLLLKPDKNVIEMLSLIVIISFLPFFLMQTESARRKIVDNGLKCNYWEILQAADFVKEEVNRIKFSH